jgi:hypothetical protein
MRSILLIASFLSLLAVTIWPCTTSFAQSSYEKSLLATDKAKGEQLAKKISTIEVLAPLAPVALSPFFGITCLSGTSILCSKGVLPENEFLMGNKALNNGLVFIVFLALSIATSLPKMTAVSKGFAEATDQLETYAGIISYLAIFYLAGAGQDTSTQQATYTAGIFTFTRDTMLMVAAAINIIVINTVKYFFELLVWISPIPALDAAFESANKVVTTALVAVYAFNPYLAMLLNIILFLICLTIFNWVRRRVKYYRTIFVEPIIAKLLGRTGSSPPAHIKARIAAVIEQAEPLLKVFPARKIHKIKKYEMSYLTVGKDGLFLVKLRLIRQPKVEKLDTTNAQIEITTGLLSNTIEITSKEMTKPTKLTFSKIYNKQIDSIAAALRPLGKVIAESVAQAAKAAGIAPAQPGIACS